MAPADWSGSWATGQVKRDDHRPNARLGSESPADEQQFTASAQVVDPPGTL